MAFAIAFIIGTLIGSFVHVVASRLPTTEPIFWGRSHCTNCQVALPPAKLVPLVSFLLNRGQCFSCQARLSWSYPLVEAGMGLVFLIPVFAFGDFFVDGSVFVKVASSWVFTAGLVLLFLTDLWYQVIPDHVSLPLIGIAILVQGVTQAIPWQNILIGSVIGGGWFGLQWIASNGRWVGGGDIRLGILAGALTGFPGIIVVLFWTYVLGALAALILMALRRLSWKGHFPLGTTLTAAILLVYFVPADVFLSYVFI